MNVHKVTSAVPKDSEAAEGAGAVAAANRCPVGHVGHESTMAKPAARRAAIPATALPRLRIPVLMQAITYMRNPTAFMGWCRDRYGSRFVVRLKIRSRPLYVISDPEDLKQMFLAPDDVLHTGDGSATLEKYFGQSGLAWLDEGAHKNRRKHIVQCVHGKSLQRIEAALNEIAEQEIGSWPQDKTIELYPLIHHLTIHVISEVIFGTAMPKSSEELREVFERMTDFNYKIASTLMIHRMSPRTVRLLTAIRPLGLQDFLKLRERADALIAEAIEERRNVGQHGNDLLSVLLGLTYDDGSPLTTRELRDEIMMMFTAGTETTAAALAWAFEYLSREHAVRDRLIAEMGTGEDSYIAATIQEVLRVRPVLPQIIIRQVMKPIEIGGVRYEPGMLLWGSALLAHSNPALYPDPYAFRPERFLGTKPGMFTWIPFGGGRIRCLGNVVAELEMKAVIREVLGRYELVRVDPRPEKDRIHLVASVPANGTRVRLRARSPQASMA